MNQMNQNTDGLIPLNELAHKNRFSEMIRTGPRDLMSTDLVLSKSRRDFSPTPEKKHKPLQEIRIHTAAMFRNGNGFYCIPKSSAFLR